MCIVGEMTHLKNEVCLQTETIFLQVVESEGKHFDDKYSALEKTHLRRDVRVIVRVQQEKRENEEEGELWTAKLRERFLTSNFTCKMTSLIRIYSMNSILIRYVPTDNSYFYSSFLCSIAKVCPSMMLCKSRTFQGVL